MARLFGYFANQADRIRCALALEGESVALADGARVDGWGVGSYQAGEVLLRKKPTEPREAVDFRDLVRDLRTDCAVVHVRAATGGSRSLENTHPFKFRQWIFAHNGAVPGFERVRPAMLERLPDFLARNVRGETDSELIFSLFLSFVHQTGRLDDPEFDRKAMTAALRETVLAVDNLTESSGVARAVLNCVVTNHHAMVALRRGMPMAWTRRQGIRDCAACRKQPDVTGREPKRTDHEGFKYVIVASDQARTPAEWFDLPDGPRGAILAIDRTLDAQVIEL